MNINRRLKMIASLIDKNKTVIDIGCDHGLLDIYLTKYNGNKCIASDINEKSLSSAINNIKKYNLDITTIVSDGFDNIDIKENSIAVIAGMGTKTIIDILNGKNNKNIDSYIIQTNTDYYLFRKFLMDNNYKIIDEVAFIDLKIPYLLIKCIRGNSNYNEIELKLGPILMNKKDKDTKEFYKNLLEQNNKILNQLPSTYKEKINEIESINKIIENMI